MQSFKRLALRVREWNGVDQSAGLTVQSSPYRTGLDSDRIFISSRDSGPDRTKNFLGTQSYKKVLMYIRLCIQYMGHST